MANNNDTIFALATPKLKSAICVFRISGKKSHKTIKEISKIKKIKTNSIFLSKIIDHNKKTIDHALVTIFRAPKSYTGENMVEISCHGSVVVIKKLTDLLLQKNLRIANPGEFTKRALLNEKINVLEAESINDLVNSETENQRKVAINNLSGSLEKTLDQILNKLKKLLADLEAIIDFADEELPRKIMQSIKEQKKNIIKTLELTLEKSKISKQIYSGFRVSVIGRPNTGKSSFINYISDQNISIVTEIPGTTRDLVTSTIEINGDKFLFIDTAGIRESKNKIEKIGIQKSIDSAEKSDLNVVFLEKNEVGIYKNIPNKIFVKSKSDLSKFKRKGVIAISSVTGYGIKGLLKKIYSDLASKTAEPTFFSRERHINSIKKSIKILKTTNINEIDIASEDVRRCFVEMQQINQKFDIENILDIIFADFCIGK